MFVGNRTVTDQDIRTISATKSAGMRVGATGLTDDGRVYRYSLAGGTTLDPGKLCVAATVNADVTDKQVGETGAVGDTSVTIEAAGAITADTYADGYLTVNDAAGEGISYLVNSHPATTAAADLLVQLAEPVKVALTNDTSELTLTQNPWSGAVISVTDQLDMPIGVPNISVTNASYGWIQTRGFCSVLADETIAVGSAVVTGGGVAGAVETRDTDDITPNVGVAVVAGVDTEYRGVFLTVD